ncbi:adhesion domain-containing protein [Aeromonas veronii]|uniref:adhesion domain-containing protein n=1 Tax=Aeromonas veronii TaxID=654 RepID=UPI002B4AA310|nr:DUF823 domain-containing adhesin [Aeromonas veronii]
MNTNQSRHFRMSVLMQLSLVTAGIYFLLSPLAYAELSASTETVHGQGAPTVPILTVPSSSFTGKAETATAASTDPDQDPIEYQFRWCSAANGTGTCLVGSTQTFARVGVQYVSAKAVTPRGYPQPEQGSSLWSADKVIKYYAVVGAGCSSGATLVASGLTYSCPMTKAEADTQGITYQGTFSERGIQYVLITAPNRGYYCSQLGPDYRVPNRSELRGLYNVYPNNAIKTTHGWPTNNDYWASEQIDASNIYSAYLSYSVFQEVFGNDPIGNIMTCVKG